MMASKQPGKVRGSKHVQGGGNCVFTVNIIFHLSQVLTLIVLVKPIVTQQHCHDTKTASNAKLTYFPKHLVIVKLHSKYNAHNNPNVCQHKINMVRACN